MPGNVDKAEIAQMREAEINGDAAPFFFFQAIGVNPGERADQRSLAVIDVSRGADDERNEGVLLLKNIGR
jgi:hypothetical protein